MVPAPRRQHVEIWSPYETAALRPDTALTSRFEASTRPADVAAIMREITDVRAEHEARQRYKAMLEE